MKTIATINKNERYYSNTPDKLQIITFRDTLHGLCVSEFTLIVSIFHKYS